MERQEPLSQLVSGYLRSAGFNVTDGVGSCFVADRPIIGAERDTRLVWVPEASQQGSYEEGPLWENISEVRANYPTTARVTIVVPRREGFSRDMQQTFRQSGIKLLAPIQFFDSKFRVEESRRAASAIADIREDAESLHRVPQPFKTDFDKPNLEAYDRLDLFQRLRKDMVDDDTVIRIIVGRAGIGKSCLFRALFHDLYESFLEAKRGLRTVRRPIPLLPEHLKKTQSLRTEDLINNFLHTDVADPVSSEMFRWQLVNGFATWMLDGLDELYAGDPGFFDYLLDLVTIPNSKAQVTIWCRDSLLTTSQAFSEFQETCAGQDILKVYRLENWERTSKRQFVWLQKEGHLPRAGEGDSNHVREFLDILDRDEPTKIISGLPLYCRILYDQYQESGDLSRFSDEVELLDYTIESICDREIEKEQFDRTSFEEDGLDDWLEQIAADYVEGQYADVRRDEVEEYGTFVLRDGLSKNERQHILTSLLNFPLFQAGRESGKVSFVHDLVADAIAARYYLKRFGTSGHERKGRRGSADLIERLAHVDIEDPSLLRFIAKRIDEMRLNTLVQELRRPNNTRSFAVALTLMMLARPELDLLTRSDVNLEERLLVGVRFSNRDLSKCSFRGSDLTYTTFDSCNLTGAIFDGAHFNHTAFSGDCVLRGAEVRKSRIQSIVHSNRLEDDIDRIHEWFAKASGVASTAGRCPTAEQFMHLFSKYVTPFGRARRNQLNERGLTAGKRFAGAASVEDCIKAAVSAGYLDERDRRGRYARAPGDKYAEMVAFVTKQEAGHGIGMMLEDLCSRPGCLHQMD